MNKKIDIRNFLGETFNSEEYEDVVESFVIFMIDNDWFQTNPEISTVDGTKTLLFEAKEISLFQDRLKYFMKNKDLDVADKVIILHSLLEERYPETAQSLKKYLIDEQNYNIQFCIYDFLVAHQSKEISKYNNQEMDQLVSLMCDEIALNAGRRFVNYLCHVKQLFSTVYSNDFVLQSRNAESRVKKAYDSETFLRLAYYLFNQEFIESCDLIEKACESRNTANTWLYLAIHMICALRDTDLAALPHPKLKRSPKEVIDLIKNSDFPDSEASLMVLSITSQLSYLSHTPNKTSKFSGISDIKLFIPESATILFGILFTLAEAHLQLSGNTEDPLIKPVRDYDRISRYMGDEIGYLFLEDNFSVRSANKTYMQAVELFADDILSIEKGNLTHAKGYMLAALARSHKGSFGKFAHTSEIYLKDANFSGYTPEFIAKELFERGVCSFIPSMLLKMVTDGEYKKIPIKHQTELITQLGLSPGSVEMLVSATEKSLCRAVDTVNEIKSYFQDRNGMENSIMKILQSIASGTAVSKQDECLCLMTAMGVGCKTPDAKQCIGCKYEISTKATIYLLMNEYNRMQLLKEKADAIQLKRKYSILLKEVVVPSIAEILSCIKDTYGELAVKELTNVIQEMQYAD